MMMGPITDATPLRESGRPLRFAIDHWVEERLRPNMFAGQYRHLLAQRGRPWHADPRHGGERGGIRQWIVLAGRHPGGGTGVEIQGADGTRIPLSWELDGATPPPYRFWADPTHAYQILELERAGIIAPVEPSITNNGPYGLEARLMEFTEPHASRLEHRRTGLSAPRRV
ncbi:hypothetical protein BW14_05960 [Bifidobacterium sp. UTBIF-68]|uniref:hypothetical protein n=1 Tax=Bifidobacterium sp. UTBIF-68 TaxID=1465262 RepID=UPI0021594E89|nr:hypothetical protein [Bifidobacterium sp. UTBIF-68]TPF93353.1 hypothetical protein BW14_05960 [Bifidobacterium sp. UTBIF-68]